MYKENAVKTTPYNVEDALNPAASVFVSANAGAGKTSLLTNRVLSLLLHGVLPSKILCLTFTNAAAAEMVSRIQKELGAWVMASDEALSAALAKLLGASPAAHQMSPHYMKRARSLFAHVLESPEGIRIQTIHGFSQSLLRRFPLEAGVSPHFTVMDARSEQELLQEARLRLFNRAQTEDPQLQEALHAIAHRLGESAFAALIQEILQHKRRFSALLSITLPDAVDRLRRLLKVSADSTVESLIATYFTYDEAAIAGWRRITSAFQKAEEADQLKAQTLIDWFAKPAERSKNLGAYQALFLTQKGTARVKLFKKGVITDEALIAQLQAEQERMVQFRSSVNALTIAKNTTHFLCLSESLLALYTRLKLSHALMDYDDLIMTACALLRKPGIAPWVLFKLDGGIDHIMVDEAQDTSPEQWTIIDALTQEFFAGHGREVGGRGLQERSLFIVGDEKQSIYSFQGADPVALGRMQDYFAGRIKAAEMALHRVDLQYSFRSTPEVLRVVDQVFSSAKAREGLTYGQGTLTHIPTRLTHPGLVELWPLTAPQENENGITISATTTLARQIASTIRTWLDEGTAQAGDIMILVRSRTTLVDRLVRALKKYNVPVAGHDRMALSDNLAVQDLVALGQCLLLPEDDLTLAALLKSPICNLSEEQLFTLAWDRGKQSLWDRLREHAVINPAFQPAYHLLTDLRARADYVTPFALYSYALETLGARARITGRMGEEYHDPIDEFLGQVLLYERAHTGSLQGFLHWLSASDSEIKRDMEQAKDAVRIMTVHGSKGLQAPIVILPDTVEVPRARQAMQWHIQEDRALPLWVTGSEDDCDVSAKLRAKGRGEMFAEYRRLLYVALTRAENRLYVCGATAKETLSEECWYQLVKEGMHSIAEASETEAGTLLRVGSVPSKNAILHTLHTSFQSNSSEEFAFLRAPLPSEPEVSHPVTPSRLTAEEPPAASPLHATSLFRRGTLIHRLLQHLPETQASERERIAAVIAGSYRQTMSAQEIDHCIAEVLRVMANPQWGFLLGEGSHAEVPVAGCVELEGKTIAVSGQIDRLCIREQEVWIVDFKSNRPIPEPIPPAYFQQMQLYRLLLQKIYPEKRVRCALVWTSVPSMTILDE